MASIVVIFYLSLLLGKCVHFESSTQLCLPRRKTEQFLLGEPHSGHIRATVTAAKLFCCCVANSAVSEGDHPVFKKKKKKKREGKENKTKTRSTFSLELWFCYKKKKTQHSKQPYALDGMAQELHGHVFSSGHCCLIPVGDPFFCFCTLPPNSRKFNFSALWSHCIPAVPGGDACPRQSSPCPHKRLNSTELCVLKIEIQKKSLLSQNLTVFFFISSPVCI